MKEAIRIEPAEGQVSAWDYPRPPAVEASSQSIRVYYQGELIAHTTNAKKVLEKAHPPCYYIPHTDIHMEHLRPNGEIAFCTYKGQANFFDLVINQHTISDIAWTYSKPTSRYAELKDYVAFFAGKGCECYVGEELASPQPSEFFGGWITQDVVGPFKGEEGTWDW